jgi:hypothetical protein
MPRPLLSRRRISSLLALLLEMTLIAGAVFLGLLADQWRENRQERRLADSTLVRFQAEVTANKLAVEEVREYHEGLRDRVAAFVRSDAPKTLPTFATQVAFQGTKAVSFERTALDLALATGSLGYVDAELAYQISRTYTAQDRLEQLQDGFRQSALSPATFSTPDTLGLGIAMEAFLTDVNIQERQLLANYAVLLAQLDATAGGGR